MKREDNGQTRSKTAEFNNVGSIKYLKLYMGKHFTTYKKMYHKYILNMEFTALK